MLPERKTASPPAIKAIDKRREMVIMPEVKKALTPIELKIFEASTKKQIANYTDHNLIEHVNTLTNFISRDVGIKTQVDDYERTRFFDILKTYYRELTLAEVKTAFELSIIGELDNFLPKNGAGEPDKNHYQQFSAEYITKILTAYRRKKRGTVKKAFDALPVAKIEPSPEEKKQSKKQFYREMYDCYLRYKYTGVLELPGVLEYLIFREFVKRGFVNEIEVSQSDKKRAFAEMVSKANKGMISKFAMSLIDKEGTEHQSVKAHAYFIARKKRIRFVFDEMVRQEIQLKEYFKI